MLRFLVIFGPLLVLTHGADHATFKDCKRVNFCSTLLGRSPTEKYQVDLSSFLLDPEGVATFTLQAVEDETDHLSVNITRLVDNTFRLQIGKADSDRYKLQEVLDGDPEVVPFDKFLEADTFQTIVAGDNSVRINLSPLTIEFYTNDELQLYFDGSRFTFERSLDQAFAFDVTFPKASQLYGIHEHADSLSLQTTDDIDPYRLRNLDVAGYELNSPMSLYGSVPVLYAHGPNSTTGLFLHNAAEQWYDITNRGSDSQAYIMVESGSLDLFIFLGPTPIEVVRQYVKLTGTAHLPQLWTLGYHQSRWNYVSQDDVKEVVANFTTFKFPLDVIWLDIDYTDSKKYFTWDSTAFSDPVEMQKNISEAHKRLVTIIDPHIKVESGYSVYAGALEQDLFVKRADGTNFEGDCWPGLSSYMDFLNPAAVDYYASQYSYENFPSSTPVLAGIWNDMNEPSVFDNSIEKTLPGDAVHYGGVAHRDVHNIYGLLHTKSTHQGLIARDNGTTRPFVLTRSHFAGTQRYSAIWTGDNTAQWGYLRVSYAECLNANLLGIVFCGADVGGFSSDPTEELLQRWYQAGVWLPFYRAHSETSTKRREPFLFGEEVQAVIRDAIELRYKHVPVWYTLFYEHTRNRDPIIRPLFYHYPEDESTYNLDDQLLVGRDILVKAVSDAEVSSVQVYFPGGTAEHWISITNQEVFEGSGLVEVPVTMEAIPVYYRRGSVIVRKDTVRLSTDEMADDGYTLHVTPDADGKATGTVYLDDYTSFKYADDKEYSYLRIDYEGTTFTLTKIDDDAVSDNFDFTVEDVVVNSVVKEPQGGQAGRYETKTYKKVTNGQLLKTIKFTFDKTASFKLAE